MKTKDFKVRMQLSIGRLASIEEFLPEDSEAKEWLGKAVDCLEQAIIELKKSDELE